MMEGDQAAAVQWFVEEGDMLQMQHPLDTDDGSDHQQRGDADAGNGHGDDEDAALRALAASDADGGAVDDHERHAVFPPVTELLAGGGSDVADVRASGAAMRLPVVGNASRRASDSVEAAAAHAPAAPQPAEEVPATAAVPPARHRAAPPVPPPATAPLPPTAPAVPVRTASSDRLVPAEDAFPSAAAVPVAVAAAPLPIAVVASSTTEPAQRAAAPTSTAASAAALVQPVGAAALLQAELAQAAAAAGGNLAPGDGHVVVLLSSLRANAEMQAVSSMQATSSTLHYVMRMLPAPVVGAASDGTMLPPLHACRLWSVSCAPPLHSGTQL